LLLAGLPPRAGFTGCPGQHCSVGRVGVAEDLARPRRVGERLVDDAGQQRGELESARARYTDLALVLLL
jgi:hypothetical protein